MQTWTVTAKEAGLKLVRVVHGRLDGVVSTRKVKLGIDRYLCRVNGAIEGLASRRMKVGEKICWDDDGLAALVSPLKVEDSRILFEDEAVVVYDKAAGVVSDDPLWFGLLRERWPTLELVHRLDRETTGVWLLAKSIPVFEALRDQWSRFEVEKSYLAVVDGVPEEAAGLIDKPIGRLVPEGWCKRWGIVEGDGGLPAQTAWQRKAVASDHALLECTPKTGRTHQLRVHLNAVGHPILGDYRYCRKFRCSLAPRRFLLHAWKLSLAHPLTKAPLVLEASVPSDMQEVIDAMVF